MCDVVGISTYTPYITAIGGLVFGGISSYLVGVKLSQRNHAHAIALMQRQEFNRAANAFRLAFYEEMTRIKTRNRGTSPDINEILGTAFPKHLSAFDEFRNHLFPQDIAAFDKAWEDYDDGRKRGHYSDYFKNPHDETPKETGQVAIERIENLLEFAKPR